MCIIPTEKVKPIAVDSSFWKPLGMRASASFKNEFYGYRNPGKRFAGQPRTNISNNHISVVVPSVLLPYSWAVPKQFLVKRKVFCKCWAERTTLSSGQEWQKRLT